LEIPVLTARFFTLLLFLADRPATGRRLDEPTTLSEILSANLTIFLAREDGTPARSAVSSIEGNGVVILTTSGIVVPISIYTFPAKASTAPPHVLPIEQKSHNAMVTVGGSYG
jgi:hypothetical protein